MSGYAENTTVSPAKSREEIERALTRFGADSFSYRYTSEGFAEVAFTYRGTEVAMRLVLPGLATVRDELGGYTPGGRKRTELQVEKEWEQRTRSRWRVLVVAITAKLAMIDAGLSTVEHEFLADVVVPGDPDRETVGRQVVPRLVGGWRAMALGPGEDR